MRGHSSLLAEVDVAIEVDRSSTGLGRWTIRHARRTQTLTTGQFRLKQLVLPASEFSNARVQWETFTVEQLNGVTVNCKLSEKASQALDKLKSLEGGNEGITCEAAPHGVAVNLALFREQLESKIFEQCSFDARRKAADRAVAQLLKTGKIERLDELVSTV